MSTKLTCPACQTMFAPKPSRSGKPVRCPTCREVHPSSAASSTDTDDPSSENRNSGGIKCPGCKRIMPRSVTYCVACNINLFDAWGGAEKNAAAVGRRNEIRGYGELAAKTVRIFLYFITLRWWKILEEF